MDFAGADGQGRGLERGDRAVSLGDAGRLEQQFGGRHRSWVPWWMGAGRVPAVPAPSRDRLEAGYSPGPLQAIGLSAVYVVQSLIVSPRGHVRVEVRDRLPALEQGLAGVGRVVGDDRGQQDGVRLGGRASVSTVSPARSLRARFTPAPPTAAVLVTAAPLRPGSLVEELRHEAPRSAPTIGTNGLLAVLMASTIGESMPDVQMPWMLSYWPLAMTVVDQLGGRRRIPAGGTTSRREDRDVGVLGEGLLEARRRGRCRPGWPAMPRM